MKTGVVVGKGPNGCQVEGKFFWNNKTYKPSCSSEPLGFTLTPGANIC